MKTKIKKILVLVCSVLGVFLLAPLSHATEAMISTESVAHIDGVEMVFAVDSEQQVFAPNKIYYSAHIHAKLGVNTRNSELEQVEVEIKPFGVGDGLGLPLRFGVLPFEFQRDTRLGINAEVSILLLDIQVGDVPREVTPEEKYLAWKLIVKAVGARYVGYQDTQENDVTGFDVGTASAEWKSGYAFSDRSVVYVQLGGTAGASITSVYGHVFSDVSATAGVGYMKPGAFDVSLSVRTQQAGDTENKNFRVIDQWVTQARVSF